MLQYLYKATLKLLEKKCKYFVIKEMFPETNLYLFKSILCFCVMSLTKH